MRGSASNSAGFCGKLDALASGAGGLSMIMQLKLIVKDNRRFPIKANRFGISRGKQEA